jgi:hypothetical protein
MTAFNHGPWRWWATFTRDESWWLTVRRWSLGGLPVLRERWSDEQSATSRADDVFDEIKNGLLDRRVAWRRVDRRTNCGSSERDLRHHALVADRETHRPHAVWQALASVASVLPTDEIDKYAVVLREPNGHEERAIFTVMAGGAAPDWDIFGLWQGDAESVRSVIRHIGDVRGRRRGASA